MWRSNDSLRMLILSFPCMVPRDQTQALGRGSEGIPLLVGYILSKKVIFFSRCKGPGLQDCLGQTEVLMR